jgi:hypothetical protein
MRGHTPKYGALYASTREPCNLKHYNFIIVV